MPGLHVEATDAKGKVYHLNVDKKGFEGEEYTISGDYLAYQDMGVPLGIPDFKGVQRDGIPSGNRIFRMPYFDPEGRMTIMQWNTAKLGSITGLVREKQKLRNSHSDFLLMLLPGNEGKSSLIISFL